MAAEWARDLAARPVENGERVLFLRRFLTARDGEAASPPMAALFLDIKRVYMQMRPRLRRVYAVVADMADTRLLGSLGFVAVGGPVEMGDTEYQGLVLDFGPRSVDGWLTRLITAESRGAGDPADAALTAS